MIRIDPYFFYQVGAAVRPLKGITAKTTRFHLMMMVWTAESWLETLVRQDVVRLKTCVPKARDLLQITRNLDTTISKEAEAEEDGWNKEIAHTHVYTVTSAAEAFETLLSGEMQFADLYYVTKKGGFDTTELTENGIVVFPKDLISKFPEAIQDAKEAARCIAFELPTAAAFHLHRINEMVLGRYYDAVTGGKERPERPTVRKYIDAMKGYQVGDSKIIGALSTLNNLHRNPVLHPEQRLDSVEDAIALLGQIHTTVTHMLKALPEAPLTLTPPPANEKQAIEDKRNSAADDADSAHTV